jgi:hypothetical protein
VQLLSDSLGGNAKTLMVVNASPVDYNVRLLILFTLHSSPCSLVPPNFLSQAAETLSSLQFAQRVKQVANNSMKSVETAQVRALKAQLKQLKSGGQSL